MRAVASLNICTLMCWFCQKYIMFEPKKSAGELCHNNEEWCKIWKGTDLCLKNDIRILAKFDQTLESLKIWTLMGFFWSKSIVFDVKKYIGDHYTGLSSWTSMQALKEK